jgi:trk system potassium uptake protein TrkH
MKLVFFVVGILVSILGGAMLVPAAADFLFADLDWAVFLVSAVASEIVGGFLILSCRNEGPLELSVRDTFVVTAFTWTAAILCGALPIYLSHLSPAFMDALFEATSALTTTGSTLVMGRLDTFSALTLWVCLLQWLGGIGIVVMALTILPFLKVGGMQLFRTESSDRSEKIMPRFVQVTRAIMLVYTFFTLMGVVSLWGAGMTPFEAVCHGFSSVSTGGISTTEQSIAFFDNRAMEMVLMALMIFGGSPIVLWVQAWRGSPRVFWQDQQFRGYIYLLGAAILVCTLWHVWGMGMPWGPTLRHSAFNVVSIVTTTGYVSSDYGQWSVFANVLFFFLIFVGGCTGSTSGGVKIFRFQVLASVAWSHLRQAVYPHGVFVARYNNQPVTFPILSSVLGFFILLGGSYIILALGLSMCHLDFMTALTGAASSLMNVGPGLGEVIGPTGNFSHLSDGAKALLMVGMLLGRLEFITVILLFTPSFWRR